ncbi:unnamed protein product [Calicophoron daubneyi]|uniref:Cysteine/serine-rich nuclear protein N-terminal domain-containing protein n=1 Tax=Calicophoron daubneyi TaxID=300641 RepID=A0AAV2TVP9_CALDB
MDSDETDCALSLVVAKQSPASAVDGVVLDGIVPTSVGELTNSLSAGFPEPCEFRFRSNKSECNGISLVSEPGNHRTEARFCPTRDADKCKRHVSFEKVDVYYFNRAQGFTCVPSQGGSTLGMERRHSAFEQYSVSGHQSMRRLEHYAVLLRKFRAGRIVLTPGQIRCIERCIRSAPTSLRDRAFHRNSVASSSLCSGSVDSSSRLLLEGDNANPVVFDEACEFDDDMDDQLSGFIECYFLQLLSIKKRRMMLRKAGLRSIDHSERLDCQAVRMSREMCGCSCVDGVCLPSQCICALNGIKCQVDRPGFPCTCVSASACQNPEGRTEFNPVRVRAHYLHTHMRLDMERQAEKRTTQTADVQSSMVENLAEEPAAKRPKIATYGQPADSNDKSSQYNPALGAGGISGQSEDDSLLSVYNTTTCGACRDCQNDRYVHILMRELANQNVEVSGGDSQSTSERSPTSPTSESSPTASIIQTKSASLREAPELTVLDYEEEVEDDRVEEQEEDGLVLSPVESLSANPVPSGVFQVDAPQVCMPCSLIEICPPIEFSSQLDATGVLPNGIIDADKPSSSLSQAQYGNLEIGSEGTISTTTDTATKVMVPVCVPVAYNAELMSNSNLAVCPIQNPAVTTVVGSLASPGHYSYCALEPISSLFASCSSATPASKIASAVETGWLAESQGLNPPSAAIQSPLEHTPISSTVAGYSTLADDRVFASEDNSEDTAATNTDSQLSLASEPENGMRRNSYFQTTSVLGDMSTSPRSPPRSSSSPYLESVSA